ncbi:hypothetical protein FQZ97_993750 [compost metagenome]
MDALKSCMISGGVATMSRAKRAPMPARLVAAPPRSTRAAVPNVRLPVRNRMATSAMVPSDPPASAALLSTEDRAIMSP